MSRGYHWSRRRLELRTCEWCQSVYAPSCEPQKYCSPACSESAAHKRQYKPRPKVPLVCRHCGAGFHGRASQKFCSHRCSDRARIEAKSRELAQENQARPCAGCGSQAFRSHGKAIYCKPCRRLSDVIKKYRLSPAQFFDMERKQGGVCRICLMPNQGRSRLVVDHCHRSGAVRGLLCNLCNSAIGQLRDNVVTCMRAARYLVETHDSIKSQDP